MEVRRFSECKKYSPPKHDVTVHSFSRLSVKGKAGSIIRLRTPFGGGKTCGSPSLYNAVRSKEKVPHLQGIRKLLRK